MDLLQTIGSRLRLLRNGKDWSQEDVANELAMSVSWYARVERGEIDMSISHIEKIAKLYNLTASDLLKMAEVNISANNYNSVSSNLGYAQSVNITHQNQDMKRLEASIDDIRLLINSMYKRIEKLESE